MSQSILHKRAADAAPAQQLGPYGIRSLIAPDETGSLTAYLVSIEPNQTTSVSYHKISEEAYYVISGRGLAILNGVEYLLEPGDFLRLPPGTTHGFVTSSERLEMLDLHTPGSRPDHDVYFVGETPPGFADA